MIIAKTFAFEAAHHLPNVPPGHQCARVHGHSYRVEVEVVGEVDGSMGWVVDFGDLKAAWTRTGATLDHTDLNDTLDNPTAENLAMFLYSDLVLELPGAVVLSVTVWETATSRATYRP